MHGDLKRYPWSKDLLNPNVSQFALHTINRGYGWVTPTGNMIYQMDTRVFLENTFLGEKKNEEVKNCHAFLTQFYQHYKSL